VIFSACLVGDARPLIVARTSTTCAPKESPSVRHDDARVIRAAVINEAAPYMPLRPHFALVTPSRRAGKNDLSCISQAEPAAAS